MKPIQSPTANTRLVMPPALLSPDDPPGTGDLPAELAHDLEGRFLVETTWQPDPLEQLALAGGSPVTLRVWGEGHPPVAVTVEQPSGEIQALAVAHVTRALGHLHGQLSENSTTQHVYSDASLDPVDTYTDYRLPDPPDFLAMWQEAIRATILPTGNVAGDDEAAGQPEDPRD